MRTNGNLTVLNMGYEFDLLQLKQGVFWNLTYRRSETNNALKISLEIMKLLYLHRTYVLTVLIVGLNITCTEFWILWIYPRPTSYLYLISTQNMTSAKWWNTSIAYERLGTFIRPDRIEEKASVKDKDMTRCSLCKFLVVPTFVTRCLHICKAARDPSSKRWNYLSRRLSCNLPYMTTFTPFK